MSQGAGRTFASFSIFNYRVFFIGAFISNMGTWMARIGQDWLVLTKLTDHSASALGYVTALQFIPIAILAPFAGAMADRLPKRRLLIATQLLLALNAGILWVLIVTGTVQLWHVYLLALMQGVISAVDNPTRQSFVPEMVPLRLVPNAVGLNSASFNGARLLGPGLAGLIIAAWGIAPDIGINALSFIAVIGSLLLMRPGDLTPAPARRGPGAIREGIAYVRHRPDIVVILFMVFMLGTFGLNFQITNALMATAVFGKGAGEYGLLGSIMAIGTLAAALIAARRTQPRLRLLLGALTGFTIGIIILGFAPTYTIYAIVLVPVGLCALTVMTCANASVQLACDPQVRGRVMALYMAIFLGGTPIGAPVIGWVGEYLGPRWTLFAGGIATGLTVVIVLLWLRIGRGVQPVLAQRWPPRFDVAPVRKSRSADEDDDEPDILAPGTIPADVCPQSLEATETSSEGKPAGC
ncbi:MFS transporter [Devriesea agamarum]|uniref:MFS transporter n=1 Tax=Devriesea agamarum TaxID=472569 RepID=UPI000A07BE2D|nr:MFS transporter [Devriesea agamarum]